MVLRWDVLGRRRVASRPRAPTSTTSRLRMCCVKRPGCNVLAPTYCRSGHELTPDKSVPADTAPAGVAEWLSAAPHGTVETARRPELVLLSATGTHGERQVTGRGGGLAALRSSCGLSDDRRALCRCGDEPRAGAVGLGYIGVDRLARSKHSFRGCEGRSTRASIVIWIRSRSPHVASQDMPRTRSSGPAAFRSFQQVRQGFPTPEPPCRPWAWSSSGVSLRPG
jgi:hypothetical protein